MTIGACLFFLYRLFFAPQKNLNDANKSASQSAGQSMSEEVIDIDYEEIE